MKGKIFLALLVLATGVIALLAWAVQPPPPTQYPTPNGYDTYVLAAQTMLPLPVDYDTMDKERLSEFINASSDVFDLVSRADSQECVVPVDVIGKSDEMFDTAGELRSLARLWTMRARLETLEGRHDEAGEILLDLWMICDRSCNGGLLIHHLVSFAGKQVAVTGLTGLDQQMSEAVRSKVATTIGAKNKNTPPKEDLFDTIMALEKRVNRRELGLFGSLLVNASDSTMPAKQQFFQSFDRLRKLEETLIKQLQTKLVPDSLAE